MDLTPIAKSGRGRGSRKALADIPAEVAETVEEAFTYFQTEGALDRLQTPEFPSKDEAEGFLSDARAYAFHRPAGRLVVEGNQAAGKTKGTAVARFSVSAYVSES